MPIPPNAIAAAQQVQSRAAHATSQQVRLIAGPGTGKSSSIEQRVCWLLSQGVPADEIYAVSFTRASAKDLQLRIREHCQQQGQAGGDEIRVSTLHSLALKLLRAGGLLARFPVDPLVMDDWEVENIFDTEFGHVSGIRQKTRREEIRRYYEAFWSTGTRQPPNYVPPNPPINQGEQTTFEGFHGPRTQTYACVLPGEIVRQAVAEMNTQTLDPIALLGMRHLIVDEFQDLNPMDLDFVHGLAARGVVLFVAGDDDQSVYSFRFAAPSGIQNIPNLYPNAELHQLDECFRCMPEVLACAVRLITSFPPQNRIPKSSASLYRHCNPAANGIVHRWRFPTGVSEARAIADSCQTLIQAGMNPRDILILLCNKNALERILVEELTTRSIPFDAPSGESFISGFAGRLGLALTRVVCAPNDYIALRTILGIRNGVGAQTCANICDSIIRNNLNFRDVFYQPLPNGAFSTRETTALNHARALCAQIATWQADDTLQVRGGDIFNIINAMLGTQEANAWHTAVQRLPPSMTLRELRDYLWSDNDEQQAQILGIVYTRQGLDIPQTDILPQRVRIMTMHGSKGLSARVVFIPGLEESLIPSGWRSPYAGLVLEAARLLYVSITRARVSCITSFAERRMIHGRTQPQTPSRFNASLNGPFSARSQGLTAAESQSVMAECAQL